MSRSPAHRLRVLAAVLTSLVSLVAWAAPASAATGAGTVYQFWGYYQLADGAWTFAQTGPDASAPADGSVEGWRFAIADQADPRFPRATPSFEDVCGGTQAGAGQKRVAVVVDYGREADSTTGEQPPAPRAACAVAPEAATGADVLAVVAEIRLEEGLTCALDGYPATGCGDALPALPPAAAEPDQSVQLAAPTGAAPTATDSPTTTAGEPAGEDGSFGAPLWLALAAAAAVAAIAVLAIRRRRDILED